MPHLKRYLIIAHDLVMTALAVLVSIVLRFEGEMQSQRLAAVMNWLVGFVIFAGAVYALFGLYKSKWRFASLLDIISIGKSVAVLGFAALAIDYVLVGQDLFGGYFLGRKTIIIYMMVQMLFLAMPRFAYRYWKDRSQTLTQRALPAAPSILVGRSYDVEHALRAVRTGALRGISAQAILSPRRADFGQSIHGVPVVGAPGALADTVADFQRQKISIRRLIVLPSAMQPEDDPATLLQHARQLGLIVSRVKTLSDEHSVIAPIKIEDLLLRPSFNVDLARLLNSFRGKRVVVTGAGGSIGSEISVELCQAGVSEILVLENSEPALHAITERLRYEHPGVSVVGHICDVRDRNRLFAIFENYRPDLVFHAAALKHVPYLERDWSEGIRTNVFGSMNVADASRANGVQAFVMISTDKAIEPTSMLGATKRLAEMYTDALDSICRQAAPRTRLISVRFGNVLGSNGSVVGKFVAQIERGGPLTITHPDMVRYFMTVREASGLVLTAAAHACKSDTAAQASTYVLKMGQPVRIVDLAERIVRLAGFEPGIDVELVYTGIRPGERLNELLFAKDETRVDLSEDGILAAQTNGATLEQLQLWHDALEACIERRDLEGARRVLQEAIPTFRPFLPPEQTPES